MSISAAELLKANTPDGETLNRVTTEMSTNRKADEHDSSKPAVETEAREDNAVVGRAPLSLDVEGNSSHKQMMDKLNTAFPPDTDVTDEVQALLEERQEGDKNYYKYPRYFAQVNGSEGFSYLLTMPDGGVSPLVFDKGIFTTTNVKITEMLQNDIKRPMGIGGVVREISATEYAKIIQSGKQYAALMGTKGLVNSGDTASAAEKENLELKAKMEELKKQLAAK